MWILQIMKKFQKHLVSNKKLTLGIEKPFRCLETVFYFYLIFIPNFGIFEIKMKYYGSEHVNIIRKSL